MKNTTANKYGISSTIPLANLCEHCGEDLSLSETVESSGKFFCCTGCSAVYQLLNNLGLESFYTIKKEQNIEKIVRPIDPESTEEYKYLNQENFISQYTNPKFPLEMKFYIEGIHCGACLWLIEKIPDYMNDVESVSLNMSTNIATVNFKENQKFSGFPEIVKRFGYKAHPINVDEQANELREKDNRRALVRISVAAVCAGNIMLLSAAIYSGARGVFEEYFTLLNFLLSLPVVTYCAIPFYKSVIATLRTKRATVDIPIVLVILVGFLISSYNYAIDSDQIYFDSVTTFIFLLLASRYFLKSIQDRISKKEPASKLLFNENKFLIWDERNRQYFLEPTKHIKPGQRIKLKKGERIPIDGTLLSNNAELNLSVLTGENIPQTVFRSDIVYAGSLLDSDEAVVEVSSVGSSTRIGKLLDEVEKNYQSKISFSSYSDKFATTFTLLVAVVAIISFVAISAIMNPSEALNRVMAFVLIACPCAFVFALPLSLGLSLREELDKGVLVKSSSTFEKLSQVKNIFFDKTGTLTKGIYKILKWDTAALSDYDLRAVLAIEKKSGHPIGRAIVSYLSEKNVMLPEVKDFKHIYTKGIEAKVGQHKYKFISDKNIAVANDINEIITTKILIYRDDAAISEVFLGDSLKEDAKYIVNLLKENDYKVHILSGDNELNVKQTALKLGVSDEDIFWSKTPEEKSQIIKNNTHTMMIGDGLNDIAAFSSADVGLSVQGSVEESLKVSDAYILNNDLYTVLELLKHGEITKNTLRRNIIFSITYNVGAGSLALLGYIDPLAAAVLMPISSLLLICSSIYRQSLNTWRQSNIL
ncbi:MAG: heavy metal translocating P-type ATPase metal-binding domain-containing protein [Thermodesulfobacteriota bacterium]